MRSQEEQARQALYDAYKFWKDLALLYMFTYEPDLALQYQAKAKPEREQMVKTVVNAQKVRMSDTYGKQRTLRQHA